MNGHRERSVLWRYGLAVALAGLALGGALFLKHTSGSHPPWLLFIVAVAVSGYLGGAGPGLLTTLLVACAKWFSLQTPAPEELPWIYSDLSRTLLFTIAGVTISLISGALHGTRRRLEAALQDSQERASQMEREMQTRRQAEADLIESEERYRTFLRNSSEAIWRVELDSPVPVGVPEEEQKEQFLNTARLAECNEEFARMYGFANPSEAAGLPFTTIFGRFEPETTNLLRLFIRSGYRLVDAASVEELSCGMMRHVFSNWAGVVRNGMLVRVWATQRDLTGIRQIQEKIQESENRFRQLAENIREAFYMWSVRPMHVLYVSPAAEEMAGCNAAGFYHRPTLFLRLVHPQDRRKVLKAVKQQVEGKPTELEYRMRRPDGAVRWIFDRAFPIRHAEGRIYRVAGIAEDITKRKQAEARTAIEHAVTRDLAGAKTIEEAGGGILRSIQEILEAQAAAIWLVDSTSERLRCSLAKLSETSPELEEFAALTCTSSFARGIGLPGRVWSSSAPCLILNLAADANFPRAEAASAAGLWSGIAFPILTGNEFTGVMEFFTRHPLVPDQALLHMMGVIGSEIGQFIQRRKAEADVQRLNRDLEKRVAERTVALEQSVSLLESFCYTVAHDLRAPLRSLEGFSHALLEDYGGLLDSVGQDYAHRIMAASRRMSRLVEDLLAYGRLSKLELPCRPLDLEMQVDDVIEQFAHEIEQKNAEIRVARPFPEAWADPVVLNQILANLLANALKFVRPGQRPLIEFQVVETEATVRLEVKDNGIGIAPEYQDRIFHVFERLHPSKFAGTGIGLAIVRKGVERMGGTCGVTSQAEVGSTFWLELLKPNDQSSSPAK